jgi:hypothetical protein
VTPSAHLPIHHCTLTIDILLACWHLIRTHQHILRTNSPFTKKASHPISLPFSSWYLSKRSAVSSPLPVKAFPPTCCGPTYRSIPAYPARSQTTTTAVCTKSRGPYFNLKKEGLLCLGHYCCQPSVDARSTLGQLSSCNKSSSSLRLDHLQTGA